MSEPLKIILFDWTGRRQLVEQVAKTSFPEAQIVYPNNAHEAFGHMKESGVRLLLINPVAGEKTQRDIREGWLILSGAVAAKNFPGSRCIVLGDEINSLMRAFCQTNGVAMVSRSDDFTDNLTTAMRTAMSSNPTATPRQRQPHIAETALV